MPPIILIVGRHDDTGIVPDHYNFIDSAFLELFAALSATPLMLALVPELSYLERCLDLASGIVFGGSQHDVNPALYGQEPHPNLGPLDALRDEVDELLFPLVEGRRIPTLAVCRGFQSFNALLGGDLFQDVPSQRPSQLEHYQEEPYQVATHEVTVVPNTELHRAVGKTRLNVNSMHHQAIRTLSPALSATAFAPDGIIEGYESVDPSWPLIGIQWHPEYMWRVDDQAAAIFRAFVAIAASRGTCDCRG